MNTSSRVPLPCAYHACLAAPPSRTSASDGGGAEGPVRYTASSNATVTLTTEPAPCESAPSVGNARVARGALVSTSMSVSGDPPSELGDEGSGRAVCASLPASSRIAESPGRDSAPGAPYARSSVLSPGPTVYVKLRYGVPAPELYMASPAVPPVSSAIRGAGAPCT